MGAPAGKKAAGKKVVSKFVLDCTEPVNDNVLDAASFEKFLSDKIKVGGKAGVLGDKVAVSRDAAKITVAAEQPFSKRYCKYLCKRYLRKQSLRDYIRVVADPKNKLAYKVCYYPVGGADASEDK